MLSAIAAILGFLSSLGPSVIGYFSQKEANAQQIKLAELNIEARKAQVQGELAIADAQAAVQQQQSLYAFDSQSSGSKFVDAFRGLVRPYITMVLFHLWIAVEVALLYYGVKRGLDLKQLVDIVWSQETAALFAAVISFWFGQRAAQYGKAFVAGTAPIGAPASMVPATPGAAPRPASRPVTAPAPINQRGFE